MRFSRAKTILPLVCAAWLAIIPAVAQSDPAAEAAGYYQRREWAQAAKAYEAIAAREPQNFAARARWGLSLRQLGKCREALAVFQPLVAANSARPNIWFAMGACHAQLNEKDKALDALNTAVQQGFSQLQQLETDPDLTALRDDPKFKALVAQVKRNAAPCDIPECKQFDFWIGEWDVVDPQGVPQGKSSIQRILGGCTILENWTGAGGYEGKSFNFYDRQLGKWRQWWVDNQGGKTDYVGELKDGAMIVVADTTLPDGKPAKLRMTFTKITDDHVRQFWEQSTDDGKTWTVLFDGQYKRRKP